MDIRQIDKSRIRRLLIRATNWVGDTVMSLPALEAVRENFPQSKITVMARPWVIPLIEHHPSVDGIIALERRQGTLSRVTEFIRAAGMLRRRKFDLAILFQNAFEAALLSYMAGIGFRVGYRVDGRGFLLSHGIERDDRVLGSHQVEYYLSILRGMGWKAVTRDPVLYLGEGDLRSVKSLLDAEGIEEGSELIGLSPGAIFGPAKRWPAGRFAVIGDRAVERWGAKVLIFGSPQEEEICRALAGTMEQPVLNLCGRTTLGEAMALIKRCNLFLTNDSGLMHVAASLDVPLVALFGSTDHMATGPLSKRAKIVRNRVDCAPCLKSMCPANFECMMGITVDQVWNEMERLREEMH